MRNIKKNCLKPLLFAGLGLTIATIVFASVRNPFDEPGRPGRPSVFDIEADWAKIRFKKPHSDGGDPIRSYRVEYKSEKNNKWELETYLDPQYSVYDVVEGTVNNRVGKNPVSFRAKSVNRAGESEPSLPSDPITFRDPF